MTKIPVTLAIMAGLLLYQESDKSQDDDDFLKGVKCVLNPKGDANEEHFVEYKKSKLYFCCGNCPKAFAKMIEKNREKLAHKANLQLTRTRQFEQVGCPFSGGTVKEGAMTEVSGVEVGFCCTNCRDKVQNTEKDEDKAQLVFNDENFKKGFKKKGSDNKDKG